MPRPSSITPPPALNLKSLSIVKPGSTTHSKASSNASNPTGTASSNPTSRATAEASAEGGVSGGDKKKSGAVPASSPAQPPAQSPAQTQTVTVIRMGDIAEETDKKATTLGNTIPSLSTSISVFSVRWSIWIRSQWADKPHLLRRLLLDLIAFLLVLLALNFSSNLAESWSPTYSGYTALPDKGFQVIPSISYSYLCDIFAYGSAFLAAILLFYRLFTDSLLPAIQYLECLCLVFLMRCTTILVTNFPDPSGTATSCPSMPLSSVLTSFPTSQRCGDVMFSGRTALIVISALAWITHWPGQKTHKKIFYTACIFMVAVGLAGIAMIVMNRTNYSVDILVAVYISVGVWWAHSYLVIARLHFKYLTRLYRPGSTNIVHLFTTSAPPSTAIAPSSTTTTPNLKMMAASSKVSPTPV